MGDGSVKAIETIRPGELVLASPEDDAEGVIEPKAVERVFCNPPSELVRLTIGKTQLRCTPPHLFYVKEKGWTAAKDLKIGDQLRTPDARWAPLTAKQNQPTPEPVHNLRIADHHTYYVGDPETGDAVLVHNEYEGTGILGDLAGSSTHVGSFGANQHTAGCESFLSLDLLSSTDFLGSIDGDPAGALRSLFQYDSSAWGGRLGLGFMQITFSQGHASRVKLDAFGNVASITDALGNQTSYTYDANGNATSVILPTGHAIHFGYDSDGHLTEVTDPLGNNTAYAFNDEGRLAGEEIVVDGETLTRSHEYDASGNLVREVDRNGRVLTYAYDELGRLTQEVWYDNAADADADQNRLNTITWTYDDEGNLASVVDNDSAYTYAYDESGRVISQTVAVIDGPVPVLVVDYGRGDADLPVSMSATVDAVADFLTTYEYDAEDRLIAIRQTGQANCRRVDPRTP